MSFNVAMLEAMQEEGLDLDACIRILRAAGPDTAAEKRRAWDRERKAEKRAEAKVSGGMSTGNPPDPAPHERDNLTPTHVKKTEPKGSSKRRVFPAPPNVPDPVWRDFLLSPKRAKAGMNDTAYAGICNNLTALAEHGFPPGEMIALAVERGWTTVKLQWVLNDNRKLGYDCSDRDPTTVALERLIGNVGAHAGTG